MSEWNRVNEATFNKFIFAYAGNLTTDIARMFEPPVMTYNDFSGGRVWPESAVAKIHMGKPREYFIKLNTA